MNDPLAVLSEREREALPLMAEGRSNAGIARRLWVAEGTVEKHVGSILTKLDLRGPRRDETCSQVRRRGLSLSAQHVLDGGGRQVGF